ncbi:MAG TPA: HAD-IB family hydrolase [bacterium]|nr:HAD-IB family hydrolase [bacterium]
MKNGRSLALFDFDGTITTKDSFLDFSIFVLGKLRFYALAVTLLPHITLYFFKMISGKTLKEKFFRKMIKGWNEEKFDRYALDYTKKKLPAILKHSALDAIKAHREKGDEVVLVSASVEQWLKYFALDQNMKLIATRLVIENGVFTGAVDGENCHGPEKVRRILEIYNPDDFEQVYAYGDSSGDREMLLISGNKFYKYFR